MMACTYHHARQMGYSKANERDRAAEGSDNGGEKTGNDQKTISHHMSPYSKVFSVASTKLNNVQRLDKKQRRQEREDCDSGKQW